MGYAFRAKYYEIESPNPLQLSRFLYNYFPKKDVSILIVPGATGELAASLARELPNNTVSSVDIEPNMVEKANAFFLSEKLNNAYSFLDDMKHLKINNKFDYIYINREAFQVFLKREEVFKMLESLKTHLKTCGEIIIDLANLSKINSPSDLSYYDPFQIENLEVFEWKRKVDNSTYLSRFRRQNYNKKNNTVDFYFRYILEDFYKIYECEEYNVKISLRKYSIEQMHEIMTKANMSVRCIIGDYDGNNYSLMSPRLITIVKPS